MPLYTKYRPRSWAEVVGQDEAVVKLSQIDARGQAFYVSGAPGTGKTTIAYILAKTVADDWGVEELGGSQLTADTMRDWERSMHLYPLGRGRAYVVNEAHRINDTVIGRLLQVLETLPPFVTVIFTTTGEGQQRMLNGQFDILPFLSRCINVKLAQDETTRQAFAERAFQIATLEQLNGAPLPAYLELADECNCNMRDMLQRIEQGSMREKR